MGGSARAEWFPGHAPDERALAAAGLDPDDLPGPYVEGDGRFWALDFHFPRGLTPLGLTTFPLAYAAGTMAGARLVGSPGSDGLSIRFEGPHLLVSLRVPPDDERRRREAELDARVAELVSGFPDRWAARAADLDAGCRELLQRPADDRHGLLELLDDAVAHEREAWQVHFEEMYVLLGGHLRYRARLAGLGVGSDLADACLAGFPTRITRSEERLFRLAAACRAAGLLGANDLDRARRHPGIAAALADLLHDHGALTAAVADVSQPSWEEDPARPLLHALGLSGRVPEPTHVGPGPTERRERARQEARRSATDPQAFDAEVAAAERANWIWWNEEHNALIDLRASVPLRRAARLAGVAVLGSADDALLCAIDELRGALAGTAEPPAEAVLTRRRRWFAEWRARRGSLPAVRGHLDTALADDPVLREVFGTAIPAGRGGRGLVGLGVSPGLVAGPVRVIRHADDLDALEPGEVLVCEATSPSWGYVFTVAGAVVCDTGGPTTHAAICARERGIPCVVSAHDATRVLDDGEWVEVDGSSGTVTISR